MSKKVIVVGAGHGGLVAAYHLAKNGYDVTVYEKSQHRNIGYDWKDYFEIKSIEYAEIEIPEQYIVEKNAITFIGKGDDTPVVSQYVNPGTKQYFMKRRTLLKLLIDYVVGAGGKVIFNCNVEEPIMFGNRIVGIKTNKGTFFADLIIDSAGVHSPIRTALPEYLGITKSPQKYEVLHTYRGCYKRLKGYDDPEYKYRVYADEDGTKGLKWLVTYKDMADILIGWYSEITQDDVDCIRYDFEAKNPYVDSKLVSGGKVVDIPVRQPLGIMVADGYAAIGDCAFMTVPVIGSGISNSIKAGKILADTILNDKNDEYSVQTLWQYQSTYFKEVGFDCCLLAVCRVFMNKVTADEVSFAFKEGIITSKDFRMNISETSFIGLVKDKDFSFSDIKDRLKKIVGYPDLKKKCLEFIADFGRFKLLQASYPEKYSKLTAEKWIKKYDDFYSEMNIDSYVEK